MFCLQWSQRFLPAVRLQSRLERWDVTKFLASSVASNHQTIQPLSLSQASGLAFGQRPIWPNTDIADEAWSCYSVHGDLLSAPEPNIWLAISTGKGKTIVWFFSEEIEFSVWNKVLLIRDASIIIGIFTISFEYFEYFEGSHLQISELKGCRRDRNNIRGLLRGRLRFGAEIEIKFYLVSYISTGGSIIGIN